MRVRQVPAESWGTHRDPWPAWRSDIGEKVAENVLAAEPVFTLLEGKYDTPLVEAEYKLEAAAADPVAAQALQVPAGSPIFLIERTSYTTGNRPVDYERLHYRGDLIRFVTGLARRRRASTQTGGA